MSHGRMATNPMQIPLKGWFDILSRMISRIGESNLSLTSAGVAFFGLLAVFPAISAILAIGGLFLDQNDIVSQLERFSGIVPPDVLSIVRKQATDVAGSAGLGTALAASLGLAVFSASRGVNTLFDGLNLAYHENEKRNFFLRNLQVLALTFVMMIGVVVGIAAIVVLPAVLGYLQLGPVLDLVTRVASWSVLIAMTVAGLSLLYRFGPSRANARLSWISIGAIVACVGWIGASLGFTFYVQNFANYNESFGALAGVIVMMIWMWISVFVILLGAELNAQVEYQTKMDSTTGAPKPRGQRGAVVADELGELRKA